MRERRLFYYAIIVGIISGLGALVFYMALDFFSEFCMHLAGIEVPKPGGEPALFHFHLKIYIPVVIITAIGGLITGFLVYRFAPEAEGHGTDAAIKAYHHLRGIIRPRVTIIKIIASAITIGSGGSGGREGPIAQIGAGFGSFLGTLLNLTDKERRILLVCGMAGGIGSIFKSPLGGALFAVEVLYKRDFETQAIIPAFISSIVAYVVFVLVLSFFTGVHSPSVFVVPKVSVHFDQLPLYIIVGIISAGFAILYVKSFYGVHHYFKKLSISNYFKPVIGAFITGTMGLFLPSVLGMGYGYVQEAIYGHLSFNLLILTVLGKILATSFSIGSGGSGGVFGPSIVIGGLLGAAIGTFFSHYIHGIQIASYVLIGMAGFIAGACKTPLAAILMTSEMTGGYTLLPALMVSAATSYLLTRDYTIYCEQVPTQFDSPVHRMEMAVDILQNIKVKEAMTPSPVTVSPEDTVERVVRLIETTGHNGYPVVENGRLVGIITFSDIERVPVKKREYVKVKEAMTPDPITTHPEEDLKTALSKMFSLEKYSTTRVGRLPVVENGNLVGILTKSDIIKAYARERKKYFI